MENELAITEMTPEMSTELRGITGENDRNIVKIPTISFDGRGDSKTSNCFQKILDEKDPVTGKNLRETIGEIIEVVILRKRNQLITSDMNAEISYFSDEYDSFDEEINLYAGTYKEVAMSGTHKEIKEAVSGLKFVNILYVSFNSEIYKIKVSGTSLDALWKYLESFNKELSPNVKDSVLLHKTKMFGEKRINEKKQEFFSLKFENSGLNENWKEMFHALRDLQSSVFSKTTTKKIEKNISASSQEHEEELPIVNIDDDYIEVEDIAFES